VQRQTFTRQEISSCIGGSARKAYPIVDVDNMHLDIEAYCVFDLEWNPYVPKKACASTGELTVLGSCGDHTLDEKNIRPLTPWHIGNDDPEDRALNIEERECFLKQGRGMYLYIGKYSIDPDEQEIVTDGHNLHDQWIKKHSEWLQTELIRSGFAKDEVEYEDKFKNKREKIHKLFKSTSPHTRRLCLFNYVSTFFLLFTFTLCEISQCPSETITALLSTLWMHNSRILSNQLQKMIFVNYNQKLYEDLCREKRRMRKEAI